MENLTQIEFTTKNGGVSPNTRKQVRNQSIKHLGWKLDNFEKLEDGSYGLPVAIDFLTKDTIYFKVNMSVGFAPKPKTKSKTTTEKVDVPNLFD